MVVFYVLEQNMQSKTFAHLWINRHKGEGRGPTHSQSAQSARRLPHLQSRSNFNNILVQRDLMRVFVTLLHCYYNSFLIANEVNSPELQQNLKISYTDLI